MESPSLEVKIHFDAAIASPSSVLTIFTLFVRSLAEKEKKKLSGSEKKRKKR